MMHAVDLDRAKCKGCTTCIKQCPTEAIRVRRGRAHIIHERCVDCGLCVRACPHHAKKVLCDDWGLLNEFKYNIALPPPALYGQFHNMENINYVLAGLLGIGFDAVYEVAKAAEMISDWTRTFTKGGDVPRPVLSSACPAAVRLVCQRFPDLISHIAPVIEPVELAAIRARAKAAEETGLPPEQIGIFFITPCPAKITAARHPLTLKNRVIDGALSLPEIYLKLLPAMKKAKDPSGLTTSGLMGVGWATTGGECAALLSNRYIAVDGVDNIISVLEDVEDRKMPEVEFVEMNACTQGCVGGCLTIENPYAARMRIKRLMKFLPVSCNKLDNAEQAAVQNQLTHTPTMQLSNDLLDAMKKNASIEELAKKLPGLGCGSCGAPSCRALAEDIVLGYASEEDCIFAMRERMMYMSGTGDAEQYLPPPFRQSEDESGS
jgi:iron only hydrogenase large subunit-like protein